MSRLEALEKRSSVSSSASGPELTLLKQQVETFKPILTQTKNSTASIVKEHKDFKTQVDALRTELEETKELVIALQNLTMDNSQKILAISMSSDQLLEGFDQTEDMDADMEAVETVGEELVEPADSTAIDLKELVKQEFNLEA
jgi:phosphoglucomutase